MKKVFKYIENLWIGNDSKPSLRSVLAIAFSIDLIINIHRSASIVVKVLKLIYIDKRVDATVIAAMSGNLAQIVLILGIEATLIAALLALKTYQNNTLSKITTLGSNIIPEASS
jgi:hypothetical protein